MIQLTRLNGVEFLLNAEMIREVESTPDTIITLSTGQKIVVRETVEAVRMAVIEYKHAIFAPFNQPGQANRQGEE